MAQWTFTPTTPFPTSSNNCDTIRTTLRDYWTANLPISSNPRDFIALFSHRDFTGSTIGCAYEPGINNPQERGYAVVQTKNFNTAEEQEITMHEIGHLFHGEHQYAREWRSASCFWFCKKGTVMIDTGLDNLLEFSEGDDLKYNAYRVRECAVSPSTCGSMASPSKSSAEQLFL